MPIRFASEAWPRPGLAEPRSASIAGFGNTGPLSSTEQKGKDCHDQDKQVQGASLGSFLVPEIDMIFGDGVGASLVCMWTVRNLFFKIVGTDLWTLEPMLFGFLVLLVLVWFLFVLVRCSCFFLFVLSTGIVTAYWTVYWSYVQLGFLLPTFCEDG